MSVNCTSSYYLVFPAPCEEYLNCFLDGFYYSPNGIKDISLGKGIDVTSNVYKYSRPLENILGEFMQTQS